MSRILVTGAAGFIGSHTVDLLLAEHHTVAGLDNFRTGRPENLVLAHGHHRFSFHGADVADATGFEPIVAAFRPEAIIHLAALVSVPESIAEPVLNHRLNLHATHVVAEAARRYRVGRIVFASSAAVYGDAAPPIHENVPKVPLSPYGAAKFASEIILLGHAAAFGAVVRCQRYFNVYGPRQDPGSPYSGVISVFAQRYAAGQAPTIFGDGEQTRDFISVHDVARANARAATTPGLATGAANICTGRPVSLKALAEILARHFPGAAGPVYAAARAGDIRHSCGVPAAAMAEIGFRPKVPLETGLAELLQVK